MAWPALIVLFVIAAAIFGTAQAIKGGTFVITFGDHLALSSPTLAMQIISTIGLIAMIALPTNLTENLQPERASLLLSRQVSRTDFFLADIASVLLIAVIYSIISALAFALYLGISISFIPIGFTLALLSIPIFLLTIYATIQLVLIITGSYIGAVMVVFFLHPVSMMVFASDQLFAELNITSAWAKLLVSVLNYLIPSTGAANTFIGRFLHTENTVSAIAATFDIGLVAHAIVSCLPFFIVGYYLMLKKEF